MHLFSSRNAQDQRRATRPGPGRRAFVAGMASLPVAAAAATDKAQPPAPRVTILFCGDSLAQGLYLTLVPLLRRREALRSVNGTQHATGITRFDEHNWPEVVRGLVARNQPDLVVFWIGANDFRPLVWREQRIRFDFGTEGFAEHYRQRVAGMVAAATEAGGRAVWLGLPNMREARMASAAKTLNDLQSAAAEGAGALPVATWKATSDPQGRYLAAMEGARGTRPMRAEDGVHFTDYGYRRVAKVAFDAAAERFTEFAGDLAGIGEA